MKKIRKTLKSALAITLCASMILSSEITLTVLAVDKPDTEPDLIEELSDEGIEKHEKIILGEIENKRSQHEKHFKLKDGAMMAVQYAIPVHFTEDGEKWTEYDNRLDLVYENGKEVYKNRKSDINITLSYISDDENMISIDKGNAKIGWGYADVGETVGMVVEKDETLAGNDRFTTLQNIISQINYENIYPDVDAEYYISSEGVKENLILKTEEAQRQFLVNYDIGKLSAKQTDEHTIMLTDGKNEIYNIKAPFMTDADGDISTDLSLSIESLKDGQLSVIMKADDKFFDEDCNYPVVLDPTIYTLQSIIESTYVNEYRPNDFTGNGSYELTTGFYSGRCYSFIKMKSVAGQW